MATAPDIHVVPRIPVLESKFWVIRDESSNNSKWVFVVVVVDQTCIIAFKVKSCSRTRTRTFRRVSSVNVQLLQVQAKVVSDA